MDRIPNVNEKGQFPYLCALISELYRWAPVTPLGIAHMSFEEVEHNGYTIPRNATILFNI
jgi:cytochrome P450